MGVTLADLAPGTVLEHVFGSGLPVERQTKATLHVRAIVDDRWVVTREWYRAKRSWRYAVNHYTLFEIGAYRVKRRAAARPARP